MNRGKIKIISFETPSGNWDYSVKFKMIENDVEEISKWICENFEEHFVLSMYEWRIIAGGCTDNTNSYDYRKSEENHVDYYQLNCSSDDLAFLKLRWV